jgi:hypothetical protein
MLMTDQQFCASRGGVAMMLTPALGGRRRTKREVAPGTFVPREEFCRLLVSSRRLVRSDERDKHICGLLDIDTGNRFLIQQDKLFAK